MLLLTVMSYLKCQTCHNGAAGVSVGGHSCEEVEVGGRVQRAGGRVKEVTRWCHSPADSCHKRFKSSRAANGLISPQRRLIQRIDLCVCVCVTMCNFVALHTKLEIKRMDTEPHPPPSSLPHGHLCPSPQPLHHRVPLSRRGPGAKCCHMVGITGLMTDRWTQ